MGKEINLLKNYPRSNRNILERKVNKTNKIVNIARKFGRDYFDGDRIYGYGGYYYNKKFWVNVIDTFIEYYNLKENSSILDVGCGKGFMLYDFLSKVPTLKVCGLDISEYAIKNSLETIKPNLKIGNANNLPFETNSFDLVISINTIHNLDELNCAKALKEIQRVSKKNSFITVDAYKNNDDKNRMDDWNLTALTYKSTNNWKKFFNENGYTGDYYWFIP